MASSKKVGDSVRSRKTQAWWDEHGDKELDIIRAEGVSGLVTRQSLKNTEQTDNKDVFSTGTLVWGFCRGWWPALVITPEDVQIAGNSKKLWVYWLTESKVSQLQQKSQVLLFCDGKKERFLGIMSKVKTAESVFVEIMEMLGDKIKCPFQKPYDVWIENNFANLVNLKNELIFYPYPPSVQKNLENLRKTQSSLTKPSTSIKRKSSIQKREVCPGKSPDKLIPDHLHVKYQKIGTIVWAKIAGQTWWPGMIIDYRDCAMAEPKVGCQWIMWYGDYSLSQVNYKYFMKFDSGIEKYETQIRQSKRELYKRGVLEACKDYCNLYNSNTSDWNIKDALHWFKTNPHECQLLESCKSDEVNSKYSEKIRSELSKHISKIGKSAVREHKLHNSEIIRAITADESDSRKTICIMCLESDKEKMYEHPFFEASLCKKCMGHHKSTIFAYDDDGKCFFCALCAATDALIDCNNTNCSRVYCAICLKYLISPGGYREILEMASWNCFLCSDLGDLLKKSLVEPRSDWKGRIQEIFSTSRYSVSHYSQYYKDERKAIRVLSLFDGISTGLLGLRNLGLEVEAYFASEVDPDAEIVSKVHFGAAVTRLGDVRYITQEIINDIVPIDLLIGGSPCNDLSLVNPKRRGLHDPNGTGILFFDYCRIKQFIEKANANRNLFWLFENVASMPEEYKDDISKNLGTEPDLIDSADFSPQHRPRYYWTNIPMASYTPFVKDLQDVLTPNCNRHALVQKIRTVTTQLKSLKQGSKALKPVIMDEEYDCLWTTELEEIFGFPRHFTDVKNLSASKRQKLIGQAWCVRTITEIMRPLTHYFVHKQEKN